VHAAITSSSTASGPPQRSALPETLTSDITGYAAPAMSAHPTAGYDSILLVAALEEIGARQAAFEWLLENNLLRVCLA
jgi:hypothetical protein